MQCHRGVSGRLSAGLLFRFLAGLVLMGPVSGRAAELYWDGDDIEPGAGNTAALLNKAWGGDAVWNSDPTGGAAGTFQINTTSGDDLTFVAGPGGGSGSIAFTSTVSGARTARSLTFQASGPVTLAGGESITLGDGTSGGGGLSVPRYAFGTSNNAAHIIATPLVLANDQAWSLSASNGFTVSGGISGAAQLTKVGAGTLNVTQTNSVGHGATVIGAGRINYNNAAGSGGFWFGSGPISLDNGARFHFSAPVGSLTLSNAFVVGSNGGTVSTPSSTGRAYAFAGGLSLGGHLTFGMVDGGGGGGPGGNYAGTITIDQDMVGTRRITLASGGNHGPAISGSIVDGAGSAGNGLVLRTVDSGNGRDATLSGNNSYAGDTVIQGVANGWSAGRYINVTPAVVDAYGLGQGNITVESGAMLRLGSNALLGAGRTITITQAGNDATGVGIGRNVDPATWINPASTGTIMIGIDASNSTASINLLTLTSGGNGILCSIIGQTGLFGGTITAGSGSVYRFGAGGSGQGAGGNLILTGANALTGNNSVQVGGWYGNTTPMGHGTLTLANSNNVTGTLTVAAGNGGNGAGSTLAARASGAFGTGNTIVLASSPANWPTLRCETAAQTHNNPIAITGTNTANITANAITTLAGSITQTNASTLNVNGTSLLILAGTNSSALGKTTLASGLLSLAGIDAIGGGNLNVAGGVLVLSAMTWSSFAADRSGGYATTGSDTWQLSSGGLAARGTAVTVTDAATTAGAGGTFDRSFTLGSALRGGDGRLYADASMVLDRGAGVDTITLSGDRTITVAGALSLTNGAYIVTGPVHEIAGRISESAGAGTLTIQGGGTGTSGSGILRLSNTSNDFVANVSLPAVLGTGFGVLIATDDAVFGDAANTVEINASSPSGNGTGWLVLFENAGGGEKTFARILNPDRGGSSAFTSYGVGAYTGAVVYVGTINNTENDGTAAGLARLNLHAEAEAAFVLGAVGDAADVQNNRDPGAVNIYRKTGAGPVVLRNVNFADAVGNAHTFEIQNGALRETGNGVSNSVAGVNLTLSGGVLETCDAVLGGAFGRTLGAGANQVQWVAGGGGFSAYGGPLTVNLGGAGAKQNWGGSFVQGGSPLIFGSRAANAAVTLVNQIGMNTPTVTREIRVVDNPSTTADRAVLAGGLDGAAGSTLQKTGDGVLVLVGVAPLSTYYAATLVSEGALLVNGTLTATSTTVTVSSGATLGGTGVVNRAVTVNPGGTLAPGDWGTGTLTVGNLKLMPGCTNVFVAGGATTVTVNGNLTLAGTLVVSGAVSGSHEVMTYGGELTVDTATVGGLPSGVRGTIDLATPGKVIVRLSVPGMVLMVQ